MLLILILLIAAIIVLPPLRSYEPKSLNNRAREHAPGNFITLTHGCVHYSRVGELNAPVVIMVHGFSAPSYMWDKNVPALIDEGYQVITFDLYGRGYSDRPNVAYDKTLFVEQINDLLIALEITEPVFIVGLSMGGAITASFVATYPEKVAKVVFVAPFNQPVDIGPLILPVVGTWLGYTVFIPSLAGNQSNDLVEPDLMPNWSDKFKVQMQYKGFRRAIIRTGKNMIQKDPSADFSMVGELRLPTLLLWGDQDKVIPLQDAARVQRFLGETCQFEKINNAGHALQYERYQQVNSKLIEFLSSPKLNG
jgi:pimeloyl-ACP methyl ester carboxylesterase